MIRCGTRVFCVCGCRVLSGMALARDAAGRAWHRPGPERRHPRCWRRPGRRSDGDAVGAEPGLMPRQYLIV